MMERLDILEKKVRLAAEQLTQLREERRKLLAEVEFLREENKRTKALIRDNELMREEKRLLANRIEKVIKKLKVFKFS